MLGIYHFQTQCHGESHNCKSADIIIQLTTTDDKRNMNVLRTANEISWSIQFA